MSGAAAWPKTGVVRRKSRIRESYKSGSVGEAAGDCRLYPTAWLPISASASASCAPALATALDRTAWSTPGPPWPEVRRALADGELPHQGGSRLRALPPGGEGPPRRERLALKFSVTPSVK
jgi:hypothetical protein